MPRARIAAMSLLAVLGLALVPTAAAEATCDTCPFQWHATPLTGGEVADIAFAPSDPDVVYLGIEVNAHAFYRSDDGGQSWQRVDGPGDHAKVVAVSPVDADRAYVAMSESVATTDLDIKSTAVSRYGGPGRDTQTLVVTGTSAGPSSASFSAFQVSSQDDSVLWAAVKGGRHGGFGGVPPRLMQSQDRGASWSEAELAVDEITALALDPRDANRVFITTGEGVYTSTGLTSTPDRVLSAGSMRSIDVVAARPDLVVAAGRHGVYQSADGGSSWRDVTTPFDDPHRVRIAPSDPDVWWAATFEGVWRTQDAGATWRDVSGPLAKNVQALAVHPTDPRVALVGHSSLWSSVVSENAWIPGLRAAQGLFRTTDAGASWTSVHDGLEERRLEDVNAHPTIPFLAWTGSPASRGGYETRDAGHNWRTAQSGTLHYPMRVVFHPADAGRVYATSWHTGGPFAMSEDGGVSWTNINEEAFFKAMRGTRFYQSDGHGSIHLHGLAADPTDPDVVYVGSVVDASNPTMWPVDGAHIFKSTDGGRSWVESDAGFPHEARTAVHAITVDPRNGRVLYAATSAHESHEAVGVFKSTDAGATWEAANNGLPQAALDVANVVIDPADSNRLLAATAHGVYASDDQAASWTRVLSAPAADVEFSPLADGVAVASTRVGVHRSADAGRTWHDVTGDLPPGPGQGIAIDASGTVVFAAVDGRGLFVARASPVEAVLPMTELGGFPFGNGDAFGSPPPEGSGDWTPRHGDDERGYDDDRRFGDDDRDGGRSDDDRRGAAEGGGDEHRPVPSIGLAAFLVAALVALARGRRA